MVDKIKKTLSEKVVGIAGAGGLGSNCAVALARTGIGRLIVADYDVIDKTNLNRQYYFLDQIGRKKVEALKENIARISTDTLVEARDITLNPENIPDLFKSCDVIVEAFDLAEMKTMLIETVLSEMPDKYLVCGNGIAGWGRNDLLHTKRTGNLFICGDEQIEATEDIPPLAPRVSIVANMQANVVLEILLAEKNQ